MALVPMAKISCPLCGCEVRAYDYGRDDEFDIEWSFDCLCNHSTLVRQDRYMDELGDLILDAEWE